MDKNPTRLRELFERAIDALPGDYRAVLARECPADAQLAEEAARMVEAHLAAEAEEATHADRTGERIGPYRIVRQIGKGGMGAVFLVSGDDGRQAALKTIRPDIASADMVARFRNERHVLAALDHPDIVRIREIGDAGNGLPYYVMDYIEGEPLDRFCRERNLNLAKRIALFRRLCLAVDYLHAHNVIHRDLKPSNVLVTAGGELKLIDFGIAKQQQAFAGPNAKSSQMILTPGYASPEQHCGLAATKASDIYSLGVIAYELLTGDRPAPDPEPPSAHALPGLGPIPKDLDATVAGCLRHEPADRHQSARTLSDQLKAHTGLLASLRATWQSA